MPETSTPPSFLVMACAVGVEPWLKAEIAREHPTLHPGFSRPGLVTFKQTAAMIIEPAAVRSVFARVVAESLGEIPAGRALADVVRERRVHTSSPARVLVHGGASRRPAGGREAPAHERERRADEERAATCEALARDLAGAGIEVGGRARPGEHVIDLFVAPDAPTWLGAHEHAPPMQPWASGEAPVALPPDAPSRAFLKIEEAIAWAELTVASGHKAVEVGSAPGGASLALLRRGVSVIGVDPGKMDDVVLAFTGVGGAPTFRHLEVPVGALAKNDLPRDVDWLALDVNLAPPVALRYAERIVGPRRARLRGAILTLKMNDAEMAAQIPTLLERVRAMGFASVQATQLPTNRREICVVALTGSVPERRPARPGSPRRASSRRGSRGPTST